MYCKHCGFQIDDDSVYCEKCGQPVKHKELDKPQNVGLDVDTITYTEEESLSTDNEPERKHIKNNPDTVTDSDDKARKIVKRILKELMFLAIFVAVAFVVRFCAYQIVISSNPIPVVTEDEQRMFSEAVSKAEWPNGQPPIDELISGSWDREKYPHNDNFGIGYPAAKYLKLGDFKWDNGGYGISQLDNITETRTVSREWHAEDTSMVWFWVFLLGLPIIRYLVIFIKWLTHSNS